MPNKYYTKGRKKEYKIVKELRQEGYDIVQRTAGSHSHIDVIAIDMAKKEILLIQSKPNNFSEKATNRLLLEIEKVKGLYFVDFQIR